MLPLSQRQTALNSRKREPSNDGVLLRVSTTVPEGHRRPPLARVELGIEPHQWCAGGAGELELGRETETGDLGPGLRTFSLCSLCMLTLQMPSRGSVTTEASELETATIAGARHSDSGDSAHCLVPSEKEEEERAQAIAAPCAVLSGSWRMDVKACVCCTIHSR